MIKKYFNKMFNSNLLSANGFMLAFVKVITMLVSVVNTMILSRLLSLTEYGTYSELLIIISIFTIVTNMGMENAINYFYNKYPKEKEKYIGNIFLIVTISGIVAAIIIFCLKGSFVDFYNNDEIGPLVIYICLKPLLDNIVSIFQPLYISLNRTKVIAIRNLIISIVKVILIPLSFYITHDIKYIFIVQLIIDIVQIVYLYLILDDETKHILFSKPNISAIKTILKYAIPLGLALMAGTLFKESDKLIISNFMDVEKLAIYSNMSKQLPFEFVVTAFTAVVVPAIVVNYKKSKESVVTLWKNYFEFSYLVSFTLCFGAIICAKELLIFLYSRLYLEGLNIFIIYLFVELFRFTFFGLILSATGNTSKILLSSVVSLIINIILNIIFYYIFGFIGPAVASLITVIIMNSIQFILSCRILKVKIIDIVDFKKMFIFVIKMLIVGFVMLLFKYGINKLVNNYLITLIIIYLLFVVINLYLNKDRIKYLFLNLK